MFYDNFLKACMLIGKKPTLVLQENKIGKSALTRWKNGGMPTDATLQKLADYFCVPASDLKGEVFIKEPTGHVFPTQAFQLKALTADFYRLNEEGQEKLLDYAADLVASGRYKKAGQAGVGQEA